MHCLSVFRKMTFTFHFIFSPLAGLIFLSLFDEITIHGYCGVEIDYIDDQDSQKFPG